MARRSFGKQEPPKANPGLKVVGRDIELGILAKDLHHFVTIDIHPFAQVSDLIRKTDFESVKCVRGILDHLRHRYGRPLDLSSDGGIESGNLIARVVVAGSNDREGRMVKISDRGRFTHELRVHADAEFLSFAFAGYFLEQRQNCAFHRAGQNGAADDYYMKAVNLLEQLADLGDDSFYLSKTQAAILVTGCSDTDHGDVAEFPRLPGPRAGVPPELVYRSGLPGRARRSGSFPR